jgi:hypothetical protein
MWTLWTGDRSFATENTSRPATKRDRYAPPVLPVARVPTAGVPAFATICGGTTVTATGCALADVRGSGQTSALHAPAWSTSTESASTAVLLIGKDQMRTDEGRKTACYFQRLLFLF